LLRFHRPNRNGFTLLEALVALTVVLAFAAALGPVLLQARRIMVGADDRVAAQILLRALLADPVDAASLGDFGREGETEGLQWRVRAEPTTIVAVFPPDPALRPPTADPARPPPPSWVAYRVIATVSFGQGQTVSADTVRLGKAELGRAEP
jgi:general secretion pathway protein I